MLVAALILGAADGLDVVRNASCPIYDFTASVIALRKLCGELQRGRTELRRIDAVVDERSSQRDLASGVAHRRSKCRKVSGQHRRRRNECACVGRILAQSCPLISTKEKQ